jgi:hypothetical protein
MAKPKKLVKRALEDPSKYTPEELAYFQLWLKAKEQKKEQKKRARRTLLEWLFNKPSSH